MNLKATPITSQARNEKSLTSRAFEPVKSLKTDILHLRFRGVGQKIIKLILNLRGKPTSNEYIAKKLNCTIRTVQNWTSRLERMGVITKSRAHLYAQNQFSVNLSKQNSFQYWYSRLTSQEQDFYNTHGMTIEKIQVSWFL